MGPNTWNRRRTLSGPPTAALLLLATLGTVTAQQPVESGELYLLDVHSASFVLAESLPAYASGDTHFIDFALLLETLEFSIARSGALWSGWFISETTSFSWQMPIGRIDIDGGESETISEAQWFESDDGVYVEASLLDIGSISSSTSIHASRSSSSAPTSHCHFNCGGSAR